MIKKLALLFGVLAMTGFILLHLELTSQEAFKNSQFIEFKNNFNKTYNSLSELNFRFGVFAASLAMIESINADKSKTFTAGVNQFSDLTFKEFKSTYLIHIDDSSESVPEEQLTPKNPSRIDWRERAGAVGAVKNQGHCGSCWAFSTVASLETAIWQSTGLTMSFSEQELVDCASGKYHNHGCNGGHPIRAYKYIVDNQLGTEEAYPYTAKTQKCNEENTTKLQRASLRSFELVQAGINALTESAAQHVVSVSIEVQHDFKHYTAGVYSAADCGEHLNHAVALVGYDTDADLPYFIVRNSWGSDWGLDGYVNMAIASGSGTCGIAKSHNVIPLL